MHPIAQIRQIRIGQPENFARNQQSAINKQPVSGKTAVTPSGLAGDGVGDPRFHGGADKAVHVYALHHYDTWRRELPAAQNMHAGGNLAYLAPNRVNLGLTQERWPDIVFHETREHSVKLND